MTSQEIKESLDIELGAYKINTEEIIEELNQHVPNFKHILDMVVVNGDIEESMHSICRNLIKDFGEQGDCTQYVAENVSGMQEETINHLKRRCK